MRSLWSAHAAGLLRHAAFALDAAVFDLAYITGPVLASSLAAGIAPAAGGGGLLALTCAPLIIIGARARYPAVIIPGAAPRPGEPTQPGGVAQPSRAAHAADASQASQASQASR